MNLWMDIFQMVVMLSMFSIWKRSNILNFSIKVALLVGGVFAGLQVLIGLGYVIPAVQGSL